MDHDERDDRDCLSCVLNEIIVEFYDNNGTRDDPLDTDPDCIEVFDVLTTLLAKMIVGRWDLVSDRKKEFHILGKILSSKIEKIGNEEEEVTSVN
jgi:hypothetical protein